MGGRAHRATAAPRAPRVRPPDAFFLAVESPRAPQHVGGVIVLDDPDGALDRARLTALVRERAAELPRLRQRCTPRGRWRRAVWADHPGIDWDWHVAALDVPAPGGAAGLERLVAGLQSEPLPRDRPLWRLIPVPGYEPGRSAVIFLMHHAVADGIGVILHALRLAEPVVDPSRGRRAAVPGAARRATGAVIGLLQLATERRQDVRLPSGNSAERRFGALEVPLAEVRDVARAHRARVSDVLLCAVAGGLSRVPSGVPGAGRMRVTVPLMMRTPGTPPEGNHTAAVMADVPVGPMAEPDRLRSIVAQSRRLHSGTRALASWFVMRRVAALFPAGLHAAFARAVYGGPVFQAVVTNLPGLDADLRLTGLPVRAVQPIVPTAPGAPLAVGALSWKGRLHVGVSAEPVVVEDAAGLCEAIRDVIGELASARAGGGRA